MGYSTNVRMVVRGPRELILREFANLRLSGDKFMQEALDEWVVMEDDPIQYRPPRYPNDDIQLIPAVAAILGKGGTNWEWYEQYPDVQAHIRIYQHFEELYEESATKNTDESFLGGAYVRIGENDDDTKSEDFGDGYDLAMPVRSIECPYDNLDKPDLRPRLAQTAA